MKEKINRYCSMSKMMAVIVLSLIALQDIYGQDPKEILRKTLDRFDRFENITYDEEEITNMNGIQKTGSISCVFRKDSTQRNRNQILY
jgi:hypothetical protein